MIVEPADQLQRHVLEGERRAVEQFHEPEIVVELLQRHDRLVAERAVGVRNHGLEIGIGDLAADERPHDAESDLLIAQTAQGADLVRRQLGPGFRHVEPAVARQAGEQHVGETKRRSGAAGRDIAQGNVLRIRGRP